jgi:hypothetical protein
MPPIMRVHHKCRHELRNEPPMPRHRVDKSHRIVSTKGTSMINKATAFKTNVDHRSTTASYAA